MSSIDAAQLMKDGTKVRNIEWRKSCYVQISSDDFIVDENFDPYTFSVDDILGEWEIYDARQ